MLLKLREAVRSANVETSALCQISYERWTFDYPMRWQLFCCVLRKTSQKIIKVIKRCMETFSDLNDSDNNHVNLENLTKLCNIDSLQEATFR